MKMKILKTVLEQLNKKDKGVLAELQLDFRELKISIRYVRTELENAANLVEQMEDPEQKQTFNQELLLIRQVDELIHKSNLMKVLAEWGKKETHFKNSPR